MCIGVYITATVLYQIKYAELEDMAGGRVCCFWGGGYEYLSGAGGGQDY